MAFTDNCDLYGAVHEDGVNRVIEHIMLQRPSWFNYASTDVAQDPERWCEFVNHTEDVTKYGNPLFTELPPLPVLGTDSPPVTLGFCVQVVRAKIDFHPGNAVSLPPELHPLKEQRFALYFRVCGAVACPSEREVNAIPVQPPPKHKAAEKPPDIPPVLVRGKLNCFCLDAFVVGHFDREFISGVEQLVGKVDGVEIVDIEPKNLEENIECYLKTAVTLALKQKLALPLATFFLDFPLFGLGTISLAPTPSPPVPNNPAVEKDQLKAFITMTVSSP